MMSLSSQAIGIFDSGVGGLTVMQQLMRTLPQERFIYFGDTARVPYGNKSRDTVERYCIENTICLMEKKIKLLVVACNTASALALSKLRQLFHIPIVGVIEPGAERAVATTHNQCIAVLGTKGTIQSGAYQAAIKNLAPKATIIPIACPLFVPLVEEQWLRHPATRLIIQEYLQSLFDYSIDTLLLGCTHYPLLSPLIQEHVGEEVKLVDSAAACADQVAHLLQQNQLMAPILQGKHQYFVSDDPEKFRSLGEHLFGHPLEEVQLLTKEGFFLSS
jgi:glutamate racemase